MADDVWEAYFRDDIYLVSPTENKIDAAKKLLRGLQEDNDCVYKLPQEVAIRETPDDDWEDFIVKSLD
ncbi:hypothetical protein [Mesorhizobium sp. SP-1A]|uniref:hypothetical protein n=1 Tax=Mesorhizobium sp. SP-1A TaxID=3077840 RepID=UPI0028F706CC|nr:hypothetical protein [Mesorhizobium sp. SP-1A]